MLALDSRLRGNDDHILFPVFNSVSLLHPVIPSSLPLRTKLTHHQNHTARCLPGLVIPEKSVTLCWPWIPAFAGMTTTYSFPSSLPSLPASLPSFPSSLPSFPASLPSFPASLPSFPRRRESKLTHHQNHTAR